MAIPQTLNPEPHTNSVSLAPAVNSSFHQLGYVLQIFSVVSLSQFAHGTNETMKKAKCELDKLLAEAYGIQPEPRKQ